MKMAEAKKKSFKLSDVVLTATDKKGKEYKLTPISFNTVDMRDMKVSGEAYYVDKAVSFGATKA